MNFFLFINRYLIVFSASIIIIFFLAIIFSKQFNYKKNELEKSDNSLSNADISEPKFAINNKSKKIFITAKEGNFITKNEILLKDNVRFKSNNFSIETDRVIFDRNDQTAKSKTKSVFKSKNTTISSEGFNIYDKGNKIIFHGSSFIILK